MITTSKNGRLCNQIIRNLAVSLIAKKHNLKVYYSSNELISSLGIELFSGSNVHDTVNILTDENYFSILECDDISYRLNSNNSYFQTKNIITLLYNHLTSDSVKSNIILNNPFKNRYNNNSDLFVHIRLTDVKHLNDGIDYYLNAIRGITFDNLYVATDDHDHDIIKKIVEIHNPKILILNEIETIQFGSTCKHILLSQGTFSAMIGYLAFFSTVYCPEKKPAWHGDIFIDKWIKV